MRTSRASFASIRKAIEYLRLIIGIYFSKSYRMLSMKIAIAATMSSFFMIVGFVSAIKGVQYLSDREFVNVLEFNFDASELYIPYGICIFVFFSLSGELKYRQECYIEQFKFLARSNVVAGCSRYFSFSGNVVEPFKNAVFYSDVLSDRTRAFALINSAVHRALLGLTNIVPSIVMMVLVSSVMMYLSIWMTLGILLGVGPVGLYLIFSVRDNDDRKSSDKEILESYNLGIKSYFKQDSTLEMLSEVVGSEFKRAQRQRMDVCRREYYQSYWANFSLFFVVAVGLYALNEGWMDIGSLVLYILSVRWFISSTLRTLNNAHTVGLSRDGCYYIFWANTLTVHEI